MLSSDIVKNERFFFDGFVNSFKNFKEIVVYKHKFDVMRGNEHMLCVDSETGECSFNSYNRMRKFVDLDGVLVPKNDNIVAHIDDLQRTLYESRRRALDNVFGYILANDWQYFVTLTFSPDKVDRENDDSCRYAYKLFIKRLRYYYPTAYALFVPERHPKSGKLHLHGLVGGCDLSSWLKVATYKNSVIKTDCGNIVYNLELYEFGFSTVCKLNGDTLRIANYISKYMIKDFGTIGYNKKSFYHTRNLAFKDKHYFNTQYGVDLFVQELINNSQIGVVDFVKETKDFYVFRDYRK